jgi:hypothetical protein
MGEQQAPVISSLVPYTFDQDIKLPRDLPTTKRVSALNMTSHTAGDICECQAVMIILLPFTKKQLNIERSKKYSFSRMCRSFSTVGLHCTCKSGMK